MSSASDLLPDDLRIKPRRCVQRHNLYVIGVPGVVSPPRRPE